MDKFCIITNSSKDQNCKVAKEIKVFLEGKGKKCMITTDYGRGGKDVEMVTDVKEIPQGTECAIVLGGDGTMIQASNDLVKENIPILGVNLGTLGFLAGIEKQNLFLALESLLNDNYEIENRTLLEGTAFCGEQEIFCGFALNDFVISKGGFCHLVCIHVYVNGELVDTYIADGLIVSTPTGSTGYNLSAGGPVMAPEVSAIIITPICPHSLNNRSLVVSSKDVVELEIGSTREGQIDESVIVLDGRILNPMVTKDRLRIRKAKESTKIVSLQGTSFFKIFRNKLGIDRK